MKNLACQTCGKTCDDAYPCSACGAVCYCSSKHLHMSRRLGHDAEECRRMKQQLGRRQDIYNFDVQWPIKSPQEVCNWLYRQRCHDSGLLQYCCPVHRVEADTLQPAHQQHTLLPGPCNSDNSRCPSRDPWFPGLPCSEQEWCKAWAPLDAEQVPHWQWAVNGTDQSLTVTAEVLQQERGAQQKQLDHQQLPPTSAGQPWLQVEKEAQQLSTMPRLPSMVPKGWSDYYLVRGIPQESPAALALHFPLTLWYCLAVLLPGRGWQLPPRGHFITVAYLGAQSELCMLPVFLELLALLPGYDVSIHMIGPDVPEHLHERACRTAGGCDAGQGSLTISCWNGCWHDAVQDWQQQDRHEQDTVRQTAADGWYAASPPAIENMHLVFAPNAGLPVFPSWVPTLQHLLAIPEYGAVGTVSTQTGASAATNTSTPAAVQVISASQSNAASMKKTSTSEHELLENSRRTRCPALFSDYCEEAAVKSQQMIHALLAEELDLQAVLNPFRQPVQSQHHGTKLPACSNCFLFGFL